MSSYVVTGTRLRKVKENAQVVFDPVTKKIVVFESEHHFQLVINCKDNVQKDNYHHAVNEEDQEVTFIAQWLEEDFSFIPQVEKHLKRPGLFDRWQNMPIMRQAHQIHGEAFITDNGKYIRCDSKEDLSFWMKLERK